ncbi:MAG: hypothetical protein LBL59_03475 [Xanthomonadaceae bacterium]|jgi:hypothetical protein|nr:hypothetical protein [Xanthomonadaceae bacterium]
MSKSKMRDVEARQESDAWESGELGLSADHATAMPADFEREIDAAAGCR